MSYTWSLNFWMVSHDMIFYSSSLLLLWLTSFFMVFFSFSTFYLITRLLKTTMNFQNILKLNQNWHTILLPSWSLILFNWKTWTYLLLLIFLSWW